VITAKINRCVRILLGLIFCFGVSSCNKKPWWKDYKPAPQEWETCLYPRLKMTKGQIDQRFSQKVVNLSNGWRDPKTGAYRIYLNFNVKNKKIEDPFDVILEMNKEEVTKIIILGVEPTTELHEILRDTGYHWEVEFSIDLFGILDKASSSTLFKTKNGYIAVIEYVKEANRYDLSQAISLKEM